MKPLMDALVRYVQVLESSAESTNQAEDRPRCTAHLAAAAGMFRALHTGSIPALKVIVAEERHGYGWSFLSGEPGSSAEAAFNEFAKQAEPA